MVGEYVVALMAVGVHVGDGAASVGAVVADGTVSGVGSTTGDISGV